MPAPNVECARCGHRWYAEGYDRREILPHYCPRCYREDVQEIPELPSKIDEIVIKARNRFKRGSETYDDYLRGFTLWRENHRELIELAGFVTGMLIILAVMYVFIFVWG